MRVELILEAIDRASGVINTVKSAAKGFGGGVAEGIRSATTIEKIEAAQKKAAAATRQARGELLGYAASGYGLYKLLDPAVEFEAGLMRLGAIAEASKEDVAKLGDQALKLGADTSFSASQSLDAMTALGAAGMKTADIMTTIPAVLDLSAADDKVQSLDRYAEIVTETLSQFRLAADQSGRAVDVLAKGSLESTASIGDMALALKYVGPIAGTTGTSLETTNAIIAQLANAGIKGTNAGTALRAVFTRLADPPKQAAKALDQLGISTLDAGGNMRPIIDILRDIDKATRAMGTGDRLAMMKAIAGQDGLGGMDALLEGLSTGKLDQLIAKMNDASGAAAKLGSAFNESTKGKLDQMFGGFETARIALGNAFLPMIADAAVAIADVAMQVAAWGQANPELVRTIGMIVAGFIAFNASTALMRMGLGFVRGNLLSVLGLFVRYNAAGRNMALIPRLFGLMASPLRLVFGIFSSGIGGFVSGVGQGIRAAGGLRAALSILGGRLGSMGGLIMRGFSAVFRLGPVLRILGGAFSGLGGPLAMASRAFVSFGMALMTTPIGWIIAGVAAIAGAAYLIYRNWGSIGPWLSNLWQGIKTTLSAAWEGIKSAFGGKAEAAIALVKTAFSWTPLGLIIQNWGAIKETVGNLLGGAVDVAAKVWDGFKSLFDWVPGLPDFSSWISTNEDAAGAVEKHADALAQFSGATQHAVDALARMSDAQRNQVAFEVQQGMDAAHAQRAASLKDLDSVASRGFFGAEWSEGRQWAADLASNAISLETFQQRLLAVAKAGGQYKSEAEQMLKITGDLVKAQDQFDKFAQTQKNLEAAAAPKAEGPPLPPKPVSAVPSTIPDAKALQGELDKVTASASAVAGMIKAIPEAANQAAAQATSVLSAVNFQAQGIAMMQTLAVGIRAGAGAAVGAVKQTVQQIRDHLPSSPAKVGPLSDLHRVKFGQTLATAVTAGEPHAIGAVRKIAAGMAAATAMTFATPGMATSAPAYGRPAGTAQGNTGDLVKAQGQFPASVAGAKALQGELDKVAASASAVAGMAAAKAMIFAAPSMATSAPAYGHPAGAAQGRTGGAVNVTVNLTVNQSGNADGDFAAKLRASAYEIAEIVKRELERRERTTH